MAFVDDDQIEKVGRELFVDVLFLVGACNGLVEAKINLVGFINGTIGYFGHRLTERLEVVGLRLVCQDVAIDKEEDSFLGTRFPKPPNNLKRCVGFSRTRCHYQQNAILAPGDRINGSIDGI